MPLLPRNDQVWIGLAVSLVVTLVAYFLFIQLGVFFAEPANGGVNFRPRTLALLAICLNVLPMNVFRRSYRVRSMKGLMIGVMLLAAAWFFYYGGELLDA